MEQGYYKTKQSVEEYITLAKGIDGRKQIDRLANYLIPNSILLELGSGPGSDWEILNKNYHVVGSDNSEEFLNHLHLTYPKGEFLHLDATTLETEEHFDGIYSNKVLHHLSDEDLTKSFCKQSQILNKGGLICHSFWKGTGSETFKGLFVNYHTEETIRTFISPYFEILISEDYAEFEKNDSLFIIARKK